MSKRVTYVELVRDRTGTALIMRSPVQVYDDMKTGSESYEIAVEHTMDWLADNHPEFDSFRFLYGSAIDFNSLEAIIDIYSSPKPVSEHDENQS